MIKKKGSELLEYLLEGNKLYVTKSLTSYYVYKGRVLYYCGDRGGQSPSYITFNDLLKEEYWVDSVDHEATVVDVIQANPGKWVAKYKFLEDWLYVGKCTQTHRIVATYDDTLPVLDNGLYPSPEELDRCVIRPAFMEKA